MAALLRTPWWRRLRGFGVASNPRRQSAYRKLNLEALEDRTLPSIGIVTPNTANLPINAISVTIGGAGFDPNKSNDAVIFNDGAFGAVTAATATSLTVTFSTMPASVGSLTAEAIVDGATNGDAVQVATVAPVVTANAASLSTST